MSLLSGILYRSFRLEDAEQVLKLAGQKGLRVGSAPDTFLGGGLQTCRKLIDDGWIGKPIAATAFMLASGPESWHPNPAFLYQNGAGPMFDMGPYYLTALIHLLGPVHTISGMAKITHSIRTVTGPINYGQKIEVEVPTHITGLLEFHSGAIGTLITSFDVNGGTRLPHIEVYGRNGTLIVPDPDTFGGPVFVRRKDQENFTEVPLTHDYVTDSRGIGAADMAHAIREGRAHRANSKIAFHVLELMHGFHISSETKSHYRLKSTCEQPEPLSVNLAEF